MGCESSDVFRFDLGPLQGQTSTVKIKSAYNSLIISPRGLQCETSFKVKRGQPNLKLKSAYNLLVISPRGLQCETNL